MRSIRPGWFDPVSATASQQRFSPTLLTQLGRADLLGEPTDEPILVLATRLAKAERGPDSGPVNTSTARRGPVIGREGLGGNLDLTSDVGDDGQGHVPSVAREARVDLEEFEQEREA